MAEEKDNPLENPELQAGMAGITRDAKKTSEALQAEMKALNEASSTLRKFTNMIGASISAEEQLARVRLDERAASDKAIKIAADKAARERKEKEIDPAREFKALKDSMKGFLGGIKQGEQSLEQFTGPLEASSKVVSGSMHKVSNSLLTSVNPAVKGFGVGLKLLSSTVEIATGAIKAVAEESDKQVRVWHDLAEFGGAGAQGLKDIADQYTKTLLTTEQFNKVIASSSDGLAAYSGNLQSGIKDFAEAQSELSNNIGDDLRRLGFTVDSMSESTAKYISIQAKSGKQEQLRGIDLARATDSYVRELDIMSRLTGASNKDLQKRQEDLLRESRYGAAVRELQAGGVNTEGVQEFVTAMDSIAPDLAKGIRDALGGNLGTEAARAANIALEGGLKPLMDQMQSGADAATLFSQVQSQATANKQREIDRIQKQTETSGYALTAGYELQRIRQTGSVEDVQKQQQKTLDETSLRDKAQAELEQKAQQAAAEKAKAASDASLRLTQAADIFASGSKLFYEGVHGLTGSRVGKWLFGDTTIEERKASEALQIEHRKQARTVADLTTSPTESLSAKEIELGQHAAKLSKIQGASAGSMLASAQQFRPASPASEQSQQTIVAPTASGMSEEEMIAERKKNRTVGDLTRTKYKTRLGKVVGGFTIDGVQYNPGDSDYELYANALFGGYLPEEGVEATDAKPLAQDTAPWNKSAIQKPDTSALKGPQTTVAKPEVIEASSSSHTATFIAGQPVIPGLPLTSDQVAVMDMALAMGNTYSPEIMDAYYKAKGGKPQAATPATKTPAPVTSALSGPQTMVAPTASKKQSKRQDLYDSIMENGGDPDDLEGMGFTPITISDKTYKPGDPGYKDAMDTISKGLTDLVNGGSGNKTSAAKTPAAKQSNSVFKKEPISIIEEAEIAERKKNRTVADLMPNAGAIRELFAPAALMQQTIVPAIGEGLTDQTLQQLDTIPGAPSPISPVDQARATDKITSVSEDQLFYLRKILGQLEDTGRVEHDMYDWALAFQNDLFDAFDVKEKIEKKHAKGWFANLFGGGDDSGGAGAGGSGGGGGSWFGNAVNSVKNFLGFGGEQGPQTVAPSGGAAPTTVTTKGVKGLLDQIALGEGTSDETARKHGLASGYDVSLGYGKYAKGSKPISQMTLAEVKQLQRSMLAGGASSTAVGKYQFIGKTLRGLQDKFKLDDSTVFSPEVQDMFGKELLKQRGLDKYQSGKMSKEQFQTNLAKEWASIATAETGRSYYGQHTGTSGFDIQRAIGGLSDTSLANPDQAAAQSMRQDGLQAPQGAQAAAGQSALDIARSHLGQNEANAGGQTGEMTNWLNQYSGTKFSDIRGGEVQAWCARFVSASLEQAGIKSAKSALAKDYKNWGQGVDVSQAKAGDVVLVPRKGGSGYHVMMSQGIDPKTGKLKTIGGNQGGAKEAGGGVTERQYDLATKGMMIRRANELMGDSQTALPLPKEQQQEIAKTAQQELKQQAPELMKPPEPPAIQQSDLAMMPQTSVSDLGPGADAAALNSRYPNITNLGATGFGSPVYPGIGGYPGVITRPPSTLPGYGIAGIGQVLGGMAGSMGGPLGGILGSVITGVGRGLGGAANQGMGYPGGAGYPGVYPGVGGYPGGITRPPSTLPGYGIAGMGQVLGGMAGSMGGPLGGILGSVITGVGRGLGGAANQSMTGAGLTQPYMGMQANPGLTAPISTAPRLDAQPPQPKPAEEPTGVAAASSDTSGNDLMISLMNSQIDQLSNLNGLMRKQNQTTEQILKSTK